MLCARIFSGILPVDTTILQLKIDKVFFFGFSGADKK